MKTFVYKFIGLTPLLMSSIASVDKPLPQIKLGTKPNVGDIDKIAEGMTYRDDDGDLYMPTQALRSSLLMGCAGMKFPGSRQSPKTIFQALVFPSEERAKVLNTGGKPIKKYDKAQVDSAINKANKARIIVVRPRIDEWQLRVPFEIDEEFAPANFEEFLDTLLRIWNRAGRVAGIGAWRPEKQGRHGKYSVEK